MTPHSVVGDIPLLDDPGVLDEVLAVGGGWWVLGVVARIQKK
jgi:hypothetical protein